MTRHVTTMTIWDAPHIPDERREQIIASYLPHERDARTKGIPALGSGRVYPFSDDAVTIEPFEPPSTWRHLAALDFGGAGEDGHPTAAVKGVHDPDADCLYITHAYRKKGGTILIHAGAVKVWGSQPWAWPRDGFRKMDIGQSAVSVRELYEGHGLNMLPEPASFEDGSYGVEAGILRLYERMQTERLKVFSHLKMWFDEYRQYHRKDGVIVKEVDDLMDATRYLEMDIRHAETEGPVKLPRPHRKRVP